MELAVMIWLILAIVIGAAASARGRSGGGWFLLALILSPLIAGLALLLFPSQKPIRTVQADPGRVNDAELRRNIERGQRGS